MVVECWAIIVVLIMLGYGFVEKGMAEVGLAVAPLLLLPITHLISSPIARFLMTDVRMHRHVIRSVMDLAAVVISCTLIGILAKHIPNKKSRRMYYILCCGFTIILSSVLIYNIFI